MSLPDSSIGFFKRPAWPAIFSILAFLALPHSPAAAEDIKTVDTREIQYRGGAVTFSIPKNWGEKYDSEGFGTFYEGGKNSGKLQVNAITMKLPIAVMANSGAKALCILKDVKPSEVENLPNGNAMAKSIERTTAQGQPVTLYWWYVAHPIPPEYVRTAIFSYAVPSLLENSPDTTAELQFLERSIQNTTFNHTLD
jgi:hypothetical protein